MIAYSMNTKAVGISRFHDQHEKKLVKLIYSYFIPFIDIAFTAVFTQHLLCTIFSILKISLFSFSSPVYKAVSQAIRLQNIVGFTSVGSSGLALQL